LNFWTISELLIRRWRWLVVGGLIFGAFFFLLASHKIKPKFTANAQLLRYESPVWKDFFQNSTPMSGETFAGLIRPPQLLRRVGTNVRPPIRLEELRKQITVEPEADTDIIKILLAALRPQDAVELLNAYLREAVAFTREYQAQQAEALAQNF